MKTVILFPCNPISGMSGVDDDKRSELDVVNQLKHEVAVIDYDLFTKTGEIRSSLYKQEEKVLLIYRGWMLKSSQYETLYDYCEELGYQLINSPASYKRCHHFGEAYKQVESHSPKLIYLPNITKKLFEQIFDNEALAEKLAEIKGSFSSEFFILKDAVKSEKGDPELFKISANISPDEFREKIIKFIDLRSSLFFEGLTFKEFVELKKYDNDVTNEWRIVIMNGQPISCTQHDALKKSSKPDVNKIMSVVKNIGSNFFTVDVAELHDGEWTIIETGDGQVSGLTTNQDVTEYYKKLYENSSKIEYSL